MKTRLLLVFVLLLTLTVTSCGNSSAGNLENKSFQTSSVNTLIENAMETEQVANSAHLDMISIKKSSDGIEWKKEYTASLGVALSDSSFTALYNTQINFDDLKLVKCENFNELNLAQKQVFYVVYLAAIAEAESDFKTFSKTWNPSDRTMNIGLLQIDQAVANNHTKGRLGNLDDGDLVDPAINLKVGVFVLKNQVTSKVARNRLFPVNSYYWQVLTQKKRVLKNIEANRSNISFCH